MSEPTENTQNQSAEIERLTKAVSDANAEAAKYRVEKRDAVEAAKAEVAESFNAKIQELEEAAKSQADELVNQRNDAAKLRAAIKADISTDKVLEFASLLQGESEDELVSHAETLKKLFTTDEQPKSKAVDPTQGKGSTNPLPLNGDPLLAAITKAVNR